MRPFRSARWLLLALLFSLLPTFSHAQIAISVGFAPPELPVYEQPFCPQPNLMWAPGYWAYGDDDYYWVPGTWVRAPYEDALWTPPYWGWIGGRYGFHGGYWGRHVGYYGGVDYGFGYGARPDLLGPSENLPSTQFECGKTVQFCFVRVAVNDGGDNRD